MATPSLVQNGTYTSGNAAYLEVTLSGVTGGNLVIGISQILETGARTFTFSDDRTQTWAEAIETPTTNVQEGVIGYLKNAASGNTTVRVTPSSSITHYLHVIEVANCSTTSPYDVSDSLEESVTGDDHYCSTAGVNTAADVIVVTTGVINAAATSVDVGTNFTSLYTGGTKGPLIQYKTSAGALTAERGYWVSVGTNRLGYSIMAVFKADAAAGTHPLPQRVFVGPTVGPFRGPF